MTPGRLKLLNLVRWIREYFVSWGLLSFIYSLTVTLLLQPLLENALRLKTPLPFQPLWAATCATLLLPGLLEALPLKPTPFVVRPGLFGEAALRRIGGGLLPLYLRHELRRGTTWLTVFLVVLGGAMLPAYRYPFFVLIAQLPLQRALYSIHRWRGLALAFEPARGAHDLIVSIWVSQALQALIAWLALSGSGQMSWREWGALGPAVLGAALSGGATALEGDSGRPWLVNFFALAAGTLGGYLCLASPWFLLLVAYVCLQMNRMASQRLKSVEHLDEDTLIP